MGWKKLFVGEKMPDKDDPKYKQRYESEVNAEIRMIRNISKDTKVKSMPVASSHV